MFEVSSYWNATSFSEEEKSFFFSLSCFLIAFRRSEHTCSRRRASTHTPIRRRRCLSRSLRAFSFPWATSQASCARSSTCSRDTISRSTTLKARFVCVFFSLFVIFFQAFNQPTSTLGIYNIFVDFSLDSVKMLHAAEAALHELKKKVTIESSIVWLVIVSCW